MAIVSVILTFIVLFSAGVTAEIRIMERHYMASGVVANMVLLWGLATVATVIALAGAFGVACLVF